MTLVQAPAPALAYRARSVGTPDDLILAAYEYGDPQGPAILFLHGYAQAAPSWDRQTRNADLARELRMVARGLRDRGMSDKSFGDEHCRNGKPWADGVKAVIEQLQLARPTLVGWSYAGRLMGDYIAAFGTGATGAMNRVAATSSTAEASRYGRALRHLGGMAHTNQAHANQALSHCGQHRLPA